MSHRTADQDLQALAAWAAQPQEEGEFMFDRASALALTRSAAAAGSGAPWSEEALEAASRVLQASLIDQGFAERLGHLPPERAQGAAAALSLARLGVIPREAMERAAAGLEEELAAAIEATPEAAEDASELQIRERAFADDVREALYLATEALDRKEIASPDQGEEVVLQPLDIRRWTRAREAQKEQPAASPSAMKM